MRQRSFHLNIPDPELFLILPQISILEHLPLHRAQTISSPPVMLHSLCCEWGATRFWQKIALLELLSPTDISFQGGERLREVSRLRRGTYPLGFTSCYHQKLVPKLSYPSKAGFHGNDLTCLVPENSFPFLKNFVLSDRQFFSCPTLQ